MASGVTWTNTMDGKNYPSAMDGAVQKALVKAGVIVERQASALAPVDLGRLRGSITYATAKERSNVDAPASLTDGVSAPTDKWTVHIGTNVDYAPHVEYGTRRMSAQPFLRPALMAHKSDITRDFAGWVREFLQRGK